MFACIGLLCLLPFIQGRTLAQESNADSLKIYVTNPIITIENSSPLILGYGKYTFKKPFASNIATFLGNNRLQAISLLSPSIELRDYGGPGSLNLFSFRGLGPMRNVIILDGIPLTSSQTGVFDVSSIPIFPGQHIAMDLGGGSSINGSGAMSATLDIATHGVLDTSFATFLGGLGSFGEQTLRLQGGMANKQTSMMANVESLRYTGNYPISFQPAGSKAPVLIERQNAGNSKVNVFARASHVFQESKIKANVWTSYVDGQRGIPGAVLTGKLEDSEAFLKEKDIMFAGAINAVISSKSSLNIKASMRTSESFFRDPFAFYAGNDGAKFLFLTKEIFSQAEHSLIFGPKALLISGIKFSHADLKGELLQPFAGANPQRSSGGFFLRSLMNLEEHEMDIGIRADMFSDQRGPAISGHFAIAHEILEDFTVSAKLTRDFRIPTFNELYYLNYGTQFLKPEQSMGIDIGCTYLHKRIKAQFSIYHLRIQDQILAIPISPVQWSARNIGNVWSSGIEASLGITMPEIRGAMQINYAFKDALDKSSDSETFNTSLPYIPRHTISYSMYSDFSTYAFGIMLSSIGERFGMIGELPEGVLTSVILINPHAEFRIKVFEGQLRIRGEIRNLLNEEYQMILNFPLPGRSYVFSLGYAL